MAADEKTQTQGKSAKPADVRVSVRPLAEKGAGVYEVTVKVNDRDSGSSVVRTSPKIFAYQEG